MAFSQKSRHDWLDQWKYWARSISYQKYPGRSVPGRGELLFSRSCSTVSKYNRPPMTAWPFLKCLRQSGGPSAVLWSMSLEMCGFDVRNNNRPRNFFDLLLSSAVRSRYFVARLLAVRAQISRPAGGQPAASQPKHSAFQQLDFG
jgi:hypothetical protein